MAGTDTQRAVVVDQTPLFALGISAAVDDLGIEVVGIERYGRDAVPRVVEGIGLAFVGTPCDLEPDALTARLKQVSPVAPAVIALVPHARPEQLVELLRCGADAITMRSTGSDELGVILEQVARGERYVAPAFVSALAGGFEVSDTEIPGVALTAREREVLEHLAAGTSSADVAARMFISPHTVKSHIARVYTKLEANSRAQALSRAVALGILT